MKKFIATIFGLMLCVAGVTSCGNKNKNNDKISVVTTIFPEYDWVREVVGDNDNVEITMLLDTGVDLHSYQPSVNDILKISSSDLFIYVGGESDGWVEDALKEVSNKDMKVINLLETLGDKAKEEEIIEGMQEEEEEEEEEVEYDEHVWLSLKNAEIFVNEISDALSEVDSENASSYQANAEQYKNKIHTLDLKYEEAVASKSYDTLLFGDRFPFRYLVDDYNLKYYAAFVGCSAESEASFETVVFLANKVDELNLHSVIVLENSDKRIANTIIQSTTNKNQNIIVFDSMQSVTKNDVKKGTSYISIMENNLNSLKEAIK